MCLPTNGVGETLSPLRLNDPTPPVERKPCLETEVHIGEQSFRALLDTGCTRSAIDEKIAKVVKKGLKLRPQAGSYRMADSSVHKTTHAADTVFRLPAFSSKRECAYSLRLVEGLLHPIILGTDFLSSQGIDILFSANALEWDDIRIPMTGLQPPVPTMGDAPPETHSVIEIAVADTIEALDPLLMIDGEMLSPSERVQVDHVVDAFVHVCLGGLGKIKAEPYVIPMKSEAKPFACRPIRSLKRISKPRRERSIALSDLVC
ncbi:hypothetical protein PC129_g8804 [Phytophthora cactorum]|uniref:Uncharacterized protein n=1 Tax=Phytophthora cactorum TaxID=29920 RepID=A0A329SE56_9STRA|nr:hypothetical protein Pcac1_g1300 [Phytophthora cactorum]KAG2807938.1 hypothetical protein PC111_g16714 [Phytophthora cactorum]KAG2824576.1 hypothetical protein PC112_g10050 [Phytophthora cactorum]KAG2858098.1 hypothetical protein PC113_g10126 [Phytophthora cactorum]KAG2891826.1 hypothetical protein PC114_g16841 [Phytophthora cactorum]